MRITNFSFPSLANIRCKLFGQKFYQREEISFKSDRCCGLEVVIARFISKVCFAGFKSQYSFQHMLCPLPLIFTIICLRVRQHSKYFSNWTLSNVSTNLCCFQGCLSVKLKPNLSHMAAQCQSLHLLLICGHLFSVRGGGGKLSIQ